MTYAQLDAQHQGIAQELFEQAEGLLEQLVAGQIVGFRLNDHRGNPSGTTCGHHLTSFGTRIRFQDGLGASGIYLDPTRPDQVTRTQIQLQLERRIASLLAIRQDHDRGANSWPALAAYTLADVGFAAASQAPHAGLPA